tara:strand:- start:51 stop:2168 length:2118 start_codon:yes stop_codon:yes gene_type:complete
MALDYSKLSTAELEAIANDDFSKLSNRTLRLLSNEPEPTALDKFKEPFKDVSVKDWAEKSFLAPMLQTMQSVTPFGMLRPDLARQNLQQGSQNLAGKVGQMAQGAYNVATNPVESAQKAYTAVTENPAGVAGEMAKGLLYDPEMLIGSGLGNVAEKGLMSAGRGVKGASDIVGGAVGRGTGYIAKPGEAPVGYQVPSSRAPLRNTVMLPEDMARFERGEMPYGQMPTEVPIQQLPRNAVERTALKLSGGEIPYQGQAARAFGERLGETYRNPFTAALDIGSIFATGGIPVLTAARSGLAGVQGIADSILARRGLDPNLPTRLADYQSGARPMPGTPPPRAPSPGPVNPATMNYPLTVQGPGQQLPPSVMTAPDLSRRVNIEGQPFNLPSQINVSNSQTARPQPVTPQQLALEKTQQIVQQQTPTPAPVVKTQPAVKAPVEQTTIRPSNVILKEINELDRNISLLRDDALANGVKPDTPAGIQYQDQMTPLSIRMQELSKELELAKKIDKKNKMVPLTKEITSPKILNGTIQYTHMNPDKTILYGNLPDGTPVQVHTGQLLDKKGGPATPTVVYNAADPKSLTKIAEYDIKGNETSGKSFQPKNAPPNVSKMMVGEPKATGPLEQSLVSKRSFNGDLQKYRYGTEKSPLTLEEYNHLKNSEFIDKQNTRDILMGMRPDLTEYSIWYKDKSGKIQNIQTYGNEFKKK